MEIKASESLVKKTITIVSIAIPVVVAILMLIPGREKSEGSVLSNLPLFHAILNASTAFCLIIGYLFIAQKKIQLHRLSMIGAFVLSSVFLVSYVIYHATHPPTKFGGEGFIRPIYFFILISHIILAAAIVPLALFSIYYGIQNKIDKHKKVTKYTLPIWLYVAITGVVVYVMMSPYY